jgi:hypothetical protein
MADTYATIPVHDQLPMRGRWSMDEDHDYKVRLEPTVGRGKKQVKTAYL